MEHTYEEVAADVKQQLSELIGISPEEIDDDNQLVEDLGASSVAIVQLFLNCQEKYDAKLENELDLLAPITIRQFVEKVLSGNALDESADEESGAEGASPCARTATGAPCEDDAKAEASAPSVPEADKTREPAGSEDAEEGARE